MAHMLAFKAATCFWCSCQIGNNLSEPILYELFIFKDQVKCPYIYHNIIINSMVQ